MTDREQYNDADTPTYRFIDLWQAVMKQAVHDATFNNVHFKPKSKKELKPNNERKRHAEEARKFLTDTSGPHAEIFERVAVFSGFEPDVIRPEIIKSLENHTQNLPEKYQFKGEA